MISHSKLARCPFCGELPFTSTLEDQVICSNGKCLMSLAWIDMEIWDNRPIEEALRSGTDKLMFELAVWQQDYNKLIDDFEALHAIALEVSSQLVYGSFINSRYVAKLAAQFNGLLKEHAKEYGLPLSSTYDANYPDKETPNEQD